jgi:hypothetical protein
MSVSLGALQPTVISLNTDVFVAANAGKYLYLTVSHDPETLSAYDEFRFRVDGTEYEPEATDHAHSYISTHTDIGQYPEDPGWVLFSLPERADASDAALLWPGGEWRPNKQVRTRLAAPIPQLAVEWDPPETVTAGTKPTIDFSVTNDGDLPSRFVAGLNRHVVGRSTYMPIGLFSKVIPANETVSWTYTEPNPLNTPRMSSDVGEIDYRYRLVWGGETKSHYFTLSEADTEQ